MHTILVDLGARFMRYAALDETGRQVAREKLDVDPGGDLPSSLKQFAAKAHIPLAGARIWISTLGPFEGEVCRPLNLPLNWRYTRRQVQEATGAAEVEMIHDSLAYALAIPRLPLELLRPVGNASKLERRPKGTAALIRMGIGLGVGALIDADGEPIPISGEGGNATLAAVERYEFEMLCGWSQLLVSCGIEDKLKHPSAENVLSGRNIRAIYKHFAPDREPPDEYAILISARNDTCDVSVRTMTTYAQLLGTFAASVALAFDPPGGLYIFSEVARDFDTRMTNAFRDRFNDKGEIADYMRGYDVFIVDYEYAPFLGLISAMGIQGSSN